MAKMNWERAAERDRMREHGTEPAFVVGHGSQVHGGAPAAALQAPSRRPSVADVTRCRSCGSERHILTKGQGPHAASVRCIDCGAFRWLKKTDAIRALAAQELNTVK